MAITSTIANSEGNRLLMTSLFKIKITTNIATLLVQLSEQAHPSCCCCALLAALGDPRRPTVAKDKVLHNQRDPRHMKVLHAVVANAATAIYAALCTAQAAACLKFNLCACGCHLGHASALPGNAQ
jgi:hypothetical protein